MSFEKKEEKDFKKNSLSNNVEIQNIIKNIKDIYGDDSIMCLGDKPESIDVISTGSLMLNNALGVGGYPKGRIIEIFGPESSGKTTLALHAIAEAQKINGKAVFIDAEHSIDPKYAKTLGVNINELILSQPNNGEEALGIAYNLAKSGKISIIVVDSVAALVPKAEIDGEMLDNSIGAHARLMSKAMRKMASVLDKTGTIMIFINQIREKVGVIYGNPEVTTGGRALKFYSSIRLDIRKGEAIKNGNDVVGSNVKIKVVKNKVAPPFKTCNIEIIYGQGVSFQNEILNVAVEKGFIKKTGSWYEFDGKKIGQGKEAVKDFFKKNSDSFKKLLDQISIIKS